MSARWTDNDGTQPLADGWSIRIYREDRSFPKLQHGIDVQC